MTLTKEQVQPIIEKAQALNSWAQEYTMTWLKAGADNGMSARTTCITLAVLGVKNLQLEAHFNELKNMMGNTTFVLEKALDQLGGDVHVGVFNGIQEDIKETWYGEFFKENDPGAAFRMVMISKIIDTALMVLDKQVPVLPSEDQEAINWMKKLSDDTQNVQTRGILEDLEAELTA